MIDVCGVLLLSITPGPVRSCPCLNRFASLVSKPDQRLGHFGPFPPSLRHALLHGSWFQQPPRKVSVAGGFGLGIPLMSRGSVTGKNHCGTPLYLW